MRLLTMTFAEINYINHLHMLADDNRKRKKNLSGMRSIAFITINGML